MKLSLHIGAKGEAFSTGHNDGELYGFTSEEWTKGRPENAHWDPWNKNVKGLEKVGKTREAVARWREETLRPEFARLLNSDGWKQHPDRRKTWEEFVESSELAPREAILQVGDKDEFPAPQCLLEAVRAFQTQLDVSGLSIIAVDFHFDESTPHAHVLFAADVNRGRLDYNGTLDKAGVKRPKKGKRGQRNNEFMTFTANARQACEDAADGWLVAHGQKKLDRERDKKAVHRSNRQFKSDMRKAEKQIADAKAKLTAINVEVAHRQKELDKASETLEDLNEKVARKQTELQVVDGKLSKHLATCEKVEEQLDSMFEIANSHMTIDANGDRETLAQTVEKVIMVAGNRSVEEGDMPTAKALYAAAQRPTLWEDVEVVVTAGFKHSVLAFVDYVTERINALRTPEKRKEPTELDKAIAEVAWNESLKEEEQRLFGSPDRNSGPRYDF